MQKVDTQQPKSLRARAIRRLGLTVVILAVLLFLPAGSVRFWRGWMFLGLTAAFWTFFFLNFLKRDPQLLERRLQRKESEPEQRLFQRLFCVLTFSGFILAGLDFASGGRGIDRAQCRWAVVLAAAVASLILFLKQAPHLRDFRKAGSRDITVQRYAAAAAASHALSLPKRTHEYYEIVVGIPLCLSRRRAIPARSPSR